MNEEKHYRIKIKEPKAEIKMDFTVTSEAKCNNCGSNDIAQIISLEPKEKDK